MSSGPVPNAAMEPKSPLSNATHTMFGFVSALDQKSGEVIDGPHSMTFRRPAAPAVATTVPSPPETSEIRYARVTAPARRNIRAWKTLVHTTACTPPVAMYRIDTRLNTRMGGTSDPPTR